MTNNPPKVNLDKKLNYRSLLGEKNWENLHPAIQNRFSDTHYNKPLNYIGTMEEVFLSPAGRILAHLCRLIGTPLALYSGKNIPTKVCVYPNPTLGGITWDRFYHFPDKPVNRVRSTKCIKGKIGLIEVVGFGFGMQLKLYENNAALYFESTQFFCQIGSVRIRIPHILSPGKTKVIQKALDDVTFRFTLDVNHAWLGQVYRQTGVFQEEVPN